VLISFSFEALIVKDVDDCGRWGQYLIMGLDNKRVGAKLGLGHCRRVVKLRSDEAVNVNDKNRVVIVVDQSQLGSIPGTPGDATVTWLIRLGRPGELQVL
jgi:hypothetical protein